MMSSDYQPSGGGVRILALFTVAAVIGLGVGNALAADQTYTESEMGLSKTSVFDDASPDAPAFNRGMPGTDPALPPTFPGAPPQIPHTIDNFVPVTMTNNMCLMCHGPDGAGLPGRVIPDSHYRDLRNAPDEVMTKLDGSRHVCVTCHAPQADAPDLVENTAQNAAE